MVGEYKAWLRIHQPFLRIFLFLGLEIQFSNMNNSYFIAVILHFIAYVALDIIDLHNGKVWKENIICNIVFQNPFLSSRIRIFSRMVGEYEAWKHRCRLETWIAIQVCLGAFMSARLWSAVSVLWKDQSASVRLNVVTMVLLQRIMHTMSNVE